MDTYFNIQLTDAEEIINAVSSGQVGDIFIRCNNVLYVREDLSEASGQNVEGTKPLGTPDVKVRSEATKK